MYNKAFWEFVKTYIRRSSSDKTIKPCVFVRENPELIKKEYSKVRTSIEKKNSCLNNIKKDVNHTNYFS